MPVDIVVPDLGESINEATVGHWHKTEGERVSVGEVLVELETDKVNLEVGAEISGRLSSIEVQEGQDVQEGEVLGTIEKVKEEDTSPNAAKDEAETEPAAETKAEQEAESIPEHRQPARMNENGQNISPLARRVASEHGVDLNQVEGSGPNQRITRVDVQRHLEDRPTSEEQEQTDIDEADSRGAKHNRAERSLVLQDKREERVRMSRRRQTIASRLVEAQHTTAMLTTFNDVDMSAVIDFRKRHKETFKKRHDVKLGLTSFFVKAAVGALKAYPRLNAEIDGDEMVLKHYYDIGIAIGDPEGLIVPVIREADHKTFAEIENDVRNFAQAAEERTLSLKDLQGGTFTVTNGGIFGSLFSTPILNPPQVGILGLHRIEDRPVAVDGEPAIRPMMYLALSYDHRIVDGREAVQFLEHIKGLIEEPERLLLEG